MAKSKKANAAEDKIKAEEEAEAKKAADLKKADEFKLTAIEPVLHDGERIAPGESFVVNKKQAAAHLKNKTAKVE